MRKHKNVPIKVGEESFASLREANRWKELCLLQRTGSIKDLRRQVEFELAPSVVLDGRKKPTIRYFADFVYWDNKLNTEIIEDSKSPHLRKDPVFRMKKHLMKSIWDFDILET